MRGCFITFEGGEGAGKSTQIKRLAALFDGRGRKVVLTREPGGSAGGEAIRELVTTGTADRWSPMTEALLVNAARRDHLERLIIPALDEGAVVISDRFADSTFAYQGRAGGLEDAVIARLEELSVGPHKPDITLILDLPPEVGLERALSRGGEARFESKGLDFHHTVRDAFLAIASANPDRCVVIDATGDADAVTERIIAALKARDIL